MMKRMVCSGIGILVCMNLAFGLAAAAQTQTQPSQPGDSLADYARAIRKDSGARSKPKVFDNDNLPAGDKLSVVGQPAAAGDSSSAAKPDESTAAAPAGDTQTASPKGTPENKVAEEQAPAPETSRPGEDEGAKQAAWKKWGERIAAQQDQIDLLTREFNVLQREYQIRAAAMYGDVGNRLRNSADWDKQDAQYKQQIADKQKAIDDAKQKLDDLQEEARRAGVPASVREP